MLMGLKSLELVVPEKMYRQQPRITLPVSRLQTRFSRTHLFWLGTPETRNLKQCILFFLVKSELDKGNRNLVWKCRFIVLRNQSSESGAGPRNLHFNKSFLHSSVWEPLVWVLLLGAMAIFEKWSKTERFVSLSHPAQNKVCSLTYWDFQSFLY